MNDSKNSEADQHARIICNIYTKLIEGIKHVDGIQVCYRSMASTLLLATFAVIWFIFSSEQAITPFPILLGVPLMCFFSIIGISALGMLDLIYQEHFMTANLLEALKLEKKYAWLPSIHYNMVSGTVHHNSPSRKAWYYITCNTTLILVSGAAIVYYLQDSTVFILSLVILLDFLIIIGYASIVLKITNYFANKITSVI